MLSWKLSVAHSRPVTRIPVGNGQKISRIPKGKSGRLVKDMKMYEKEREINRKWTRCSIQ